MLLDIVILPPPLLRKKLGKLAITLSKDFRSKYIVDNSKLIPHLSIFHINISPKNLNRLIKIVNNIVCQSRPFKVKSSGLEVNKFSVGLSFNLPSDLKKLNSEVVEKYFNLRQGIMPLTFKERFSVKELAAISKYGTYGTVGAFYKPHITLGVLIKQSKKVKLLQSKFSFKVNDLALGKVNKYYQVTKVIKKFKL